MFRGVELTQDGASAGTSSLRPGTGKEGPEDSHAVLRGRLKAKCPLFGSPAPWKSGFPLKVKKWTRNKHAIMFQLSNKVVQVIFFDKTEAVLSSKLHTVTYVDKRGQASPADPEASLLFRFSPTR